MSSATTAVVAFTAPISVLPITSYTAVSTPGGITGTLNSAGSGNIVVNGLSSTTVYTFVVYATSGAGNGPTSARSNIVWPYGSGQATYVNTGSYVWAVPAGVNSISVVAVGGGGGGAAPGCPYNGSGQGPSSFSSGPVVVIQATAGGSQTRFSAGAPASVGGAGSGSPGAVGYSGGGSPKPGCGGPKSGGGGAAGYAGNGGTGGQSTPGNAGAGGGGGGGYFGTTNGAGGGGGVGIYGQGASGAAGTAGPNYGGGGGGGSGGVSGACGSTGGSIAGAYGGGGGSLSPFFSGGSGGGLAYINNYSVSPAITYTVVVGGAGAATVNGATGGVGAVRLVWPGNARSFPTTYVVDCTVSTASSFLVPPAPTLNSVVVNSSTQATVTFTAAAPTAVTLPTYQFTAVASATSRATVTASISTSGSYSFPVTGLTPLTTYTFYLYATNLAGDSSNSNSINSATYVASGSSLYTFPGTYCWVAPSGVTAVSAVVVGGGGGGAYPGSTAPALTDGGASYFRSTCVVRATGGGAGCTATPYPVGAGGSVTAGTGGAGGSGSAQPAPGRNRGGAGGGAGGYSGAGGAGAPGTTGNSGSGGGGGGGTTIVSGVNGGSGGGGVGLFGQGCSGAGGTPVCSGTITGGRGGSGGLNGASSPGNGGGAGGLFGGGGGGGSPGAGAGGAGGGGALAYINNYSVTPGSSYPVVVGAGGAAPLTGDGGKGAVRIVWPGQVRQFPSTNVGAFETDTVTLNQSYVPSVPTVTSVSPSSSTAITVNFTAPTYAGGSAVTSYTAVATSGTTVVSTGNISTAGSYFVLVRGLHHLPHIHYLCTPPMLMETVPAVIVLVLQHLWQVVVPCLFFQELIPG